MEKLFKFLMLVICLSINAQGYVPFPTGNASWSQIHQQQGSCDIEGYCRFQYKMSGDTTLNSRQYHKIYLENDSLSTFGNTQYVGAMREDAKKIYYQPEPSYAQEIRLYDFSKNVGDTIEYLDHGIRNQYSTITRIESMVNNGISRKVYYFDKDLDDHVWIEGIGSTVGLLIPSYHEPTCSCKEELVCFHQNNEVILINPTYSCFPVIDGIKNPTACNTLTISPNPVTGLSIIHWEILENNPYSTFVITDILGKNVKILNVSGKSEVSIDRNDFKEGLYFGRLVDANYKNQSIKIIIP